MPTYTQEYSLKLNQLLEEVRKKCLECKDDNSLNQSILDLDNAIWNDDLKNIKKYGLNSVAMILNYLIKKC